MFVGKDDLNTKCPSSFITVPIASQEKLSSYKFLSKSASPKKEEFAKENLFKQMPFPPFIQSSHLAVTLIETYTTPSYIILFD